MFNLFNKVSYLLNHIYYKNVFILNIIFKIFESLYNIICNRVCNKNSNT